MQKRIVISDVLVLIFFLTGCAGLGKQLEPPRVTLSNITVQKITFFEATIEVELRVFNTNDMAIEVKGTECRLDLMGNHFATGVSNTRTKISSYESATIPIVVYSSFVSMIKGLLNLQNEEKLKYKITGSLRLEGGALIPSTVPFKSEGEISMGSFKGMTP